MTYTVDTPAAVQPTEIQLYDCRDAFENKLRELDEFSCPGRL